MAADHDFELAYQLLCGAPTGVPLSKELERKARKALAMLILGGRLDQGLREMLAALFDPDPPVRRASGGLGELGDWAAIAGERILKFENRMPRKHRTVAIRNLFVGFLIQQRLDEARKNGKKQSIENMLRDFEENGGFGLSYDTLKNIWSDFKKGGKG